MDGVTLGARVSWAPVAVDRFTPLFVCRGVGKSTPAPRHESPTRPPPGRATEPRVAASNRLLLSLPLALRRGACPGTQVPLNWLLFLACPPPQGRFRLAPSASRY